MWAVVGQQKAVSLLKSAFSRGNLAHAYLFSGPPHAGKMTLATKLAQAVNCEGGDPPCGKCRSCERIGSEKHADVRVIGVESRLDDGERPRREIGIDQIREMQHQVNLPPFEGKCKVFITNGAEALSTEAANSLLKTLEEPVGKVIFILLTTDVRLLPETIISRCQHLRLSPLAAGEIESYLMAEMGLPADRARLLSRLSRGRIGWAIEAAQDESLLKEHEDTVKGILDLATGDYEARFSRTFGLVRESGFAKETLELMLEVWRDLMLIKLGLKEKVVNIDTEPELTELARNMRLEEIRGFVREIQAAKIAFSLNASQRLILDNLMLSMPRQEGVI